jgi:Enoyl-CoA hydratase/carnithine racemase
MTTTDTSTKKLLNSDVDGVRTLTLNRPEKLNALDTELTTALRDAFLEADRDPEIRALVITGAGRGFCAGADLGEFADLTPDHQHLVAERAELTAAVQALPPKLGIPVISAVAGPVVGGGAGIALASDMIVAADNVTFGYPEIKHSIVPALVMTGLERHLPRKLAFELISTARLLTAHELLELHVVNSVVPVGEALPRAQAIAAQWATASPPALRAIKSLFYRVADLPTDAAIRAGQDVNTIMRGFRS